ncbi:hypothetical protein [Pararhizobium sp. A13]|uniref:hypothetical protein n=1 Tax=Pararhizobium sp. A13 TaxID=3133975 RepID=UPI00311B42A8
MASVEKLTIALTPVREAVRERKERRDLLGYCGRSDHTSVADVKAAAGARLAAVQKVP